MESGNSSGSSFISRLSFFASAFTFCLFPDLSLSFLTLTVFLPLSAPDSPPDIGDSIGEREEVASMAEIGLGSVFTTGEGEREREEREW